MSIKWAPPTPEELAARGLAPAAEPEKPAEEPKAAKPAPRKKKG